MAKKKLKAKKTAPRKSKKITFKKKPTKKSKKTASRIATKSKLRRSETSLRPKWIAEGSNPVSPLLIVRDVDAALDFYKTVFGFKVTNVLEGPGRKILHAEMAYRDSQIMLNPENRERGAFAPQGFSPVTLYMYVADVDAVVDLARLNGGRIVREPEDMFWGDRCSIVIDPDGHNWTIATHMKDVRFEDMEPPG